MEQGKKAPINLMSLPPKMKVSHVRIRAPDAQDLRTPPQKKKAMYPCDGTQNKTCIVERHGHRELRFRLHGGTATHVAVGASFSKPTQPEYVNL